MRKNLSEREKSEKPRRTMGKDFELDGDLRNGGAATARVCECDCKCDCNCTWTSEREWQLHRNLPSVLTRTLTFDSLPILPYTSRFDSFDRDLDR